MDNNQYTRHRVGEYVPVKANYVNHKLLSIDKINPVEANTVTYPRDLIIDTQWLTYTKLYSNEWQHILQYM